MDEIFEIIKAINRLKETVLELCSKIDFLSKSPGLAQLPKYVDEAAACKILHVCPRVLAQMRADKAIPFIKSHRKILYLSSDLDDYLGKNCSRQ